MFAAFLPPGRHQFLIYSHELKRAYAKDYIVDLNTVELFPEFPEVPPSVKKNKAIERQDVWARWVQPSMQEIEQAFETDTTVLFGR